MCNTMSKRVSKYGVYPLILNRWSPRGFTDKKLTQDQINALLEAAKWAPSCYNE